MNEKSDGSLCFSSNIESISIAQKFFGSMFFANDFKHCSVPFFLANERHPFDLFSRERIGRPFARYTHRTLSSLEVICFIYSVDAAQDRQKPLPADFYGKVFSKSALSE